jgi:hypothetical protein
VGIGSDDHHVVRINGDVVHTHYGGRSAAPAQDRFKIPLKQGWNQVLIKCGDDRGDWGFYFQIVDPDRKLRFAPRLPDDAAPTPETDDNP